MINLQYIYVSIQHVLYLKFIYVVYQEYLNKTGIKFKKLKPMNYTFKKGKCYGIKKKQMSCDCLILPKSAISLLSYKLQLVMRCHGDVMNNK